MTSTLPELTALEARILGVLMEKEKTTPDAYPLTVNGLAAGCNQKTSRHPVMNVSEAEIQTALEELRNRLLVLETYGASGRVLRYAHNFGKCYGVPAGSAALLAILMLRGPQTASELRANCERLHRFGDASSVEAYLEELATRTEGPLTVRLPKAPGSREHRWMHLLCGSVAMTTENEPAQGSASDPDRCAALEARVEQLERELASLREELRDVLPPSTGD